MTDLPVVPDVPITEIQLLDMIHKQLDTLVQLQNRLDIITAILLLVAAYFFFREIYRFMYKLF